MAYLRTPAESGVPSLRSEAASKAQAVVELSDMASFTALAHEWNALAQMTGNEPFYQHDFIRIWIENFAPASKLHILTARDSHKQLVGALPLCEQRLPFYGVSMLQIGSTTNDHSCRFDLLAGEAEADKVASAFLSHLLAIPGWDVLWLADVPEKGKAWRLYEAAEQMGLPTGSWPSQDSPYISLPATAEQLQDQLAAKFLANCRRRRRKLEKKGQLTFERFDGGEELEQKLAEGFWLEQSGWKGRSKTAIAQDVATRGFYTELALAAERSGHLSLYFLRLNGRPVAFQYGLSSGDCYYLLKPAYDEAHKACSPGQLLMEQVVQDCMARGLKEFDFLGPDMPWKRDWTQSTRQHHWLFIFRDNTLGRAMCAAKFKWLPTVKEHMARWRRLGEWRH